MARFPASRDPARRRASAWQLALFMALVAPGAALGGERKPNDPLERLNRATYAFNDALDRMLAKPLARGYKSVTPQPVRGAVSNFLANLYYPTTALNQFLQGKFRYGFSDSARFVVNSTIGIGGFFDPATKLGLGAHDEDFGQTLGHWGVPPGPYLVLPLFGPSDFRDAPTRLIDTYTEVPHYAPKPIRTKTGLIVRGARGIDQRAQLIGADEAINNAFDPYALLRDAYVRQRQYNVMDGNVPPESFDDDVDTEGSGAGPAAGATANPATGPSSSATEPQAAGSGATAGL
jgi:phospholipid-binding lipoprotein MlaA